MEVSVKGEYALRAVFDLACHQSEQPIKIAKIAERQRIPQKFLELILSQLKQGGFLSSRRGAEGGYFLARQAESITVGDILRHVDGPIAPAKRGGEKDEISEDSPFPELWERVERALSSVVDRTSFADLVTRWKEKRAKRVVNWQI